MDNENIFETEGGNYFKIYIFMHKHLGLKGSELIVYATIFSISWSSANVFFGSKEYFGECFGICKKSVANAFRSLLAKDLIIKEKQRIAGTVRTTYRINPDMLPDIDMFALESRCRRNRALLSGGKI